MSSAPPLLNDDGTASMATAIMMSHHAFRLALARLAKALAAVEAGDHSRVEALRAEWEHFHKSIHGHHQSEDHGVFPGILAEHESARATIEKLGADHRRIDPLIERGDAAFAALPARGAAAIVLELQELLHPHLALEEAEIIPYMRGAKGFPPPPNDEAAGMYAQGFAWAMHGIAPAVIDQVKLMLPESISVRLPEARAAFAARCERAWGTAKAGAAHTPIPDPLP